MVKKVKPFLVLGLSIPALALVNKLIFMTNALAVGKVEGSFYPWRYGKVHYTVKGNGKPLLLLHSPGIGHSLSDWEENLTELSCHFKVYALDLPGFGYSDKPNLSYSYYLYVSLINEFIQNVIQEKTAIIATQEACAYAVLGYRLMPNYYDKLMLISPEYQPQKGAVIKTLLEVPLLGTTIYNVLSSRLLLTKKNSSSKSKKTSRLYKAAHYGNAKARFSLAAYFANHLSVDIQGQIDKIKIPSYIVYDAIHESDPKKFQEECLKFL